MTGAARAAVAFEEFTNQFTTVLSDHSRIEMGPIYLFWFGPQCDSWMMLGVEIKGKASRSKGRNQQNKSRSWPLGQLWNQPSQKPCEATLECTNCRIS